MAVKLTPEMELRALRERRQLLKKLISDTETEVKKINVSILKLLNKINKTEWIMDGLNTQIIQPYKTTYDWDAIRASVDPKTWAEIVQEVPSEDALTVAIGQGRVSPSLVARHSTKTPRDPYIKVDKAAAPKEEE